MFALSITRARTDNNTFDDTLSYLPTIFVVDDDDAVRNAVSMSLSVAGFSVKEHASAQSFLGEYSDQPGCLIADVQMPNMSGLELQQELKNNNIEIPIIFITGHGDVRMSVHALKAGAIDFIENHLVKINWYRVFVKQ